MERIQTPMDAPALTPAASELTLDDLQRMPRGGETVAGLKRSLLYALARAGSIELVRVVQPGRKQGATLINLRSLRQYLETQRRQAGSGAAGGAR